MKRAIQIIVPLILVITILLGSAWYLFVYDRAFTRDILLTSARFLESNGQSKLASWFYDQAYSHADNNDEVAIELANQFVDDGNFTQAERILQKAINNDPTANLYIELSRVFLAQDKVLDAVQLLDNVRDPAITEELNRLRPKAPVSNLDNGQYNQYMEVSIEGKGGTLYVNASKEYPSIAEDKYTGALTLRAGENQLYAVVVSDNGLISPLSIFAYTIVDVIEKIDFQDAAIEAAVRQELGIYDEAIYSDDLWKIEEFIVPEDVKTFADLAYFKFLRKLTIDGGPSNELSLLSELTRLEYLSIANVTISSAEVNAIGELSSLETLSLSKCGITTISGLERITRLKYLDLSYNPVRNLEPLAQMTKLETLNLQRTSIVELTALSNCTSLKELDVSFNVLTSLEPIYGLSSLRTLNAGYNILSEINFTGTTSGLEVLTLNDNQLTSISSLSTCMSLKELDISNNKLTDISVLTGLPALSHLNFASNQVYVIPSFSKDCALIYLNGTNNEISSISPLVGLEKINTIILDGNGGLTTVDALTGCHSLIKVSVANTGVGSVHALTSTGVVVIK